MRSDEAFIDHIPSPPPESIPVSVLVRLYRFLRWCSHEERLEFALFLTTRPELMNEWCKRSLLRYERRYSNTTEPFHPKRPRLPDAPIECEVESGHDFAVLLADRPRERWWEVENAPELRFKFIDHEIPPLRTAQRRRFEDGLPSTAGMVADLLLVQEDGTPIVGEVKVATVERYDTDPVLALVQGLTLCAQLANPDQRERLVNIYPFAQFEPTNCEIDLYVISVKPEQSAPSTYQPQLYEAGRRLAAVLTEQPNTCARQIVFLDATCAGRLELRVPT